MPRKMQSGTMEFLGRRNKRLESRTTLEILIDNGDILRKYYFATAELFFKGVVWEPLLKGGSQIRSSLTRASDNATAELHNTDTEIGKEFLALDSDLVGAELKIGRYWKDLESGGVYHKVMLTGPIVGLEIDENVVRVTAVSEPYANIDVGATRRVSLSCQWQFRNPNTCGYAGSLLTCDFTLNGTGGCEGRHGGGVGATLKRAKFGGMAFLSSKSRLKTL
jgi:hypothetical protein